MARSLRGARTLELGCGLGLPSIAAVLAGARVLATDWSSDAVAMARHNAARNGVELETLQCSWMDPGPLLERAPCDLVLASDVLYEPRNGDALLELLPRLVGERGEVWIADPGRPGAAYFFEFAEEAWVVDPAPAAEVPQGAVHRMRLRGSA
jgi:predicted nicotinamide N-methyase